MISEVGKCKKYNKTNIGKTFFFTLLKEITLPNSSLALYVIGDGNNCKFTIPKNNYQHYGFRIGQIIKCILDKINCDGQIFFEPQNPHYNEKMVCEFEFVEFRTIKNYLGLNEQIGVVKDFFGKEQWIRYAQGINQAGNTIKALIVFIKKGKLFLLPELYFQKNIAKKQTFDFIIVAKNKLERFGDVYILNDKNGNVHVLPIKYYQNCNLKKNVWFKGIITKFSSKGFFYIEPLPLP